MVWSGKYIRIPDELAANTELPMSAKMLFGAIAALVRESGICFASNKTLGERIGLKPDMVSKLIKQLSDFGAIRTELYYFPNGSPDRRIMLTGEPFPPPVRNYVTPPEGITLPPLIPVPPPTDSSTPPPEGITPPPVIDYVTPTDSVTTPPVRNYDITEYLQDNLTDPLQELTLAAKAAAASEPLKEKKEKIVKEKPEAGPPRAETIAHPICVEIWMQYCKYESLARPTWSGQEGGKEGKALKEILEKLSELAREKLAANPNFIPKAITELQILEHATGMAHPFDLERIHASSLENAESNALARQLCEIFAFILNASDKVDAFFTKNMNLSNLNLNLLSILKELKNGKPQSKSKGFVEPDPAKLNTALSTVNAEGYQRRF